jgi:dTDP-4-dehydrorhamnose 3,5-epimerase
MKIEPQKIPEVLLITPPKFSDSRGFFSETWSSAKLGAAGFTENFVQDNQSLSTTPGTIRGLHCQIAPNPQGKLVRVIKGSIWDVAVDIRTGSPTYGQQVAAVLSEENWQQLWIPAGFLHGFCTLEPYTEVIYKVTGDYDRAAERAVIWNDATLNLPWPVEPGAELLSDKDKVLPSLADCEPWFTYK